MNETTKWAALLCAVVSLTLLAQSGLKRTGTNPASRLATIDSLVHRGTFAIDQSVFRTIDQVRVDGRILSSKPPLLPVVGAGAYGLYTWITGWSFGNQQTSAVQYVTFMLAVVPHLLLLVYFYRFLLLWVRDPRALICTFACVSLGYLGMGYATTVNNHSPAAAATLIAFYYAYLVRRGHSGATRHWLLAGLFAGLAPTLEMPAGLVTAGIAIYLASHDWRRTLKLFAGSVALPVVIHLFLTWMATGSVLPLYMRGDLYLYAGSYWNKPRAFDALNEPKHIYLFHMTLGHHGYFSMTPVFFLAVVSVAKAIRDRSDHFAEALLVGSSLLLLILFFVVRTRNYGGTCVGFRWLIFTMPLLLMFVGSWLDQPRSQKAMALFVLLFAVGLYNTLDARHSPWQVGFWNRKVREMGLGSFGPSAAKGAPPRKPEGATAAQDIAAQDIAAQDIAAQDIAAQDIHGLPRAVVGPLSRQPLSPEFLPATRQRPGLRASSDAWVWSGAVPSATGPDV